LLFLTSSFHNLGLAKAKNIKLQYFQQLDTLRFIAVVLVCLHHWLPHHSIESLQLGRIGVELFFVISGFLISRILINLKDKELKRRFILKTFLVRRILRIFPAYYFIVILSYIFNSGHFDKAIKWNLSYTSNFYMLSIGEFPGIMSHFWTLSVEEHFYLIWPILILFTPKKYLLSTILLSVFLGIGTRIGFYILDYPIIYSQIFTLSCFDAFAIGGLMGYFYLLKDSFYQKVINSNWLLGILISCLLLIILNDIYFTTFSLPSYIGFRTVFAVVAVFIIGRSIKSDSKFLNNKLLRHFGKTSYSMYLFHNFVPGFLLGVSFTSNIYLRIVLYFVVLIVASHLSYKLIETPFNFFKKHFRYN